MRAIPIPLLALVMTARVAADGPAPARIEIFTDARHPVETATHHKATVYRLDTLKRFERQLNVGLPADIKTAKREAIDRVQRIGRTAAAELKRAHEGLLKARGYGLERYPAIVFDDEAVVYGVTYMKAALAHYRRWRQQHEGRLP